MSEMIVEALILIISASSFLYITLLLFLKSPNIKQKH